MSACLVLVDVDNSFPRLTDQRPAADGTAPGLLRRCGCEIDTSHVVLGINTATARHLRLAGAQAIQAMASRSLGLLGLPSEGATSETVLALSAPESTDRLLMLAARAAPTEHSCGPFHHLALISADLGLMEGLFRFLKLKWPRCGSRQNDMFMWCCHDRPLTRIMPVRGRPAGSAPQRPAVPPGPVIPIDSDHLASWAAQLPVQLAGTLPEVAETVERSPALLTQAGLTVSSRNSPVARGVGRLEALITAGQAQPLIGPCDRDEGLELLAPPTDHDGLPAVASIRKSPLGQGAVRMHLATGGMLTARTQLPILVLRALEGTGPATKPGLPAVLDDEAVLSGWEPVAGYRQLRTVLFKQVKASQRAICQHAHNLPDTQDWWWYVTPKRRAVTDVKLSLGSGLALPAGQVSVPAEPTLIRNPDGRPALAWCLPAEIAAATVIINDPIEAGTTGVGQWHDRAGTPRNGVILALAPVAPGKLPGNQFVQIQRLGDWATLKAEYQHLLPEIDAAGWFRLQLVPLIVAGTTEPR